MKYSLIVLHKDDWEWDKERHTVTIKDGRKTLAKLHTRRDNWKDIVDLILDWYVYYDPKQFNGSIECDLRQDDRRWLAYCHEHGIYGKDEVQQMRLDI